MNLQTHSNAQSSHSELRNPNNGDESNSFFEDFESACSTPYVSAPSSPGRGSSGAGGGGFFYSAPASPIHFSLTSSSFIASSSSSSGDNSVPMGYEFEFSARFGSAGPVQPGSMSSADELFLNGKIRPMKLSTHLERPQVLAPLLDLDHEEGEEDGAGVGARGRDLRFRDKSLRRRTRSMSPMRREWTEAETEIEAQNDDEEEKECGRIGIEEKRNNGDVYDDDDDENDTKLATNASSASAPSSRSSSAGRNSKRWMFLKEFLRSKSEGRSNHKYFWSNISSAVKDKKSSSSSPPPLPPQNSSNASTSTSTSSSDNISTNVHDVSGGGGGVSSPMNEGKKGGGSRKKAVAGTGARVKPANGVVEKSKNKKKKKTYELHYTANRAQAEEMRKKTYLPYRQGLLGCLGFSSKGYGAVNGLARALNPVSSR